MEGNVEWRPELVGSDYEAAICSARPELEEEDVRRRQSEAKVRWSVEEELHVGELASPCVGELASPCGGASSGHGVCVSELGIDSIRG